MDFTITKYRKLLQSLIQQGYQFQTFQDFLLYPQEKIIVLRHDVDLYPRNSLTFARIQAENKIKAVYYFRAVPESWDASIIKEISDLGHEVGYHYENLTTHKGDIDAAYFDFKQNLNKLRELVPVSTICMHGSPISKYDSKDIWKKYDYKDMGIIGEPYLDVNFNEVFYLTDTGRKWDGNKVSVRDKVKISNVQRFRSTTDIIKAAHDGKLPDKVMFTFHPQRWSDQPFFWFKELLLQNIKNLIKKYFFVENTDL